MWKQLARGSYWGDPGSDGSVPWEHLPQVWPNSGVWTSGLCCWVVKCRECLVAPSCCGCCGWFSMVFLDGHEMLCFVCWFRLFHFLRFLMCYLSVNVFCTLRWSMMIHDDPFGGFDQNSQNMKTTAQPHFALRQNSRLAPEQNWCRARVAPGFHPRFGDAQVLPRMRLSVWGQILRSCWLVLMDASTSVFREAFCDYCFRREVREANDWSMSH